MHLLPELGNNLDMFSMQGVRARIYQKKNSFCLPIFSTYFLVIIGSIDFVFTTILKLVFLRTTVYGTIVFDWKKFIKNFSFKAIFNTI